MTFVNDIIGSVKAIIADPKEGAKKFVDSISWIAMAVMTAVYAVLDVIYGIWIKVKANIEHYENLEDAADDWDMDVEDYIDDFNLDESIYEVGDIIKGVLMDILYVAAGVAITAVVFFFAIKLIKKVQITWKQAFAISVIDYLIIIPVFVVIRVLDFIPDFKLLSWIMTAITSAKSFIATILTYLGVKSVCEDTKSTVYTCVPAYAVISIVSSLIYFILGSIL